MPHLFARRESRARAGLVGRFSAAARRALAILVGLGAIAAVGCGGLSVREPWLRNAIADRAERIKATNQLSSATGAVLLRFDLLGTASVDPGRAARMLEQKLEAEPVHDGALALAEISYQAGLLERQRSPKSPPPAGSRHALTV